MFSHIAIKEWRGFHRTSDRGRRLSGGRGNSTQSTVEIMNTFPYIKFYESNFMTFRIKIQFYPKIQIERREGGWENFYIEK